jgi:hypothetical protein
VLGAHQDAVVAEAWLRERIAAGDPVETYATGMLAGLLRVDALQATRALPDAWHRASRRRLRSWM